MNYRYNDRRKANSWAWERCQKFLQVLASATALLYLTGQCLNVEGLTIADSGLSSTQSEADQESVTHPTTETVAKRLPHTDPSTPTENDRPKSDACPLQKSLETSDCDKFYILVSTIDGKVSALDLHNRGKLAWSIQADSRPLYSSSLAHMEMIRNGKKMRLIPSLDGALYQFDGEKVEAVPMSAESLLSSTYRLSDDSMVVGSKDLRNYGINLHTGEVVFTCSSEGCSKTNEESNESLDANTVLVVTRTTQVVRLVDIKNGIEKWNFSVGTHQLNLQSNSKTPHIEDDDGDDDDNDSEEQSIPIFTTLKEECTSQEKFPDDIDYANFIRLLVPEGKVVALDKKDSSIVTWEHKFKSPIAKAWLLRRRTLTPMSLFDGRHIPTLSSFTPEDLENESTPDPMLYIGSHNKLLYIQPSPQMEAVLRTFSSRRIGHVFDEEISISWRPYLNTASFRTPIFGGNRPELETSSPPDKKDKKGTSLQVWHEDYPFDTGYFLYPEFRDKRSTKRGELLLIEDMSQKRKDEESVMDIFPSALWMYWKEVVGISILFSIVVHITLTHFSPGFVRSTSFSFTETETKENSKNNSHGMIVSSDSSPMFSELNSSNSSAGEYMSRFSTDFECLHCLGKGGFGIVFEAVNKVDDMHYAIKRTMLPKSEGAKEKVLREVRALAKLEHIGIVRYFNAWVESPPPGWQEERDREFQCSQSSEITPYSGPLSVSPAKTKLNHRKHVLSTLGDIDEKQQTNPLSPGCREEASLNSESIVFDPEASDVKTMFRKSGSGSGEFSVRSNISFGSDNDENKFSFSDVLTKDSSLLQYKSHLSDEKNLDLDYSSSISSIPFSNYSNSSLDDFKKDVHLNADQSGDSVVFEVSGHSKDKHNALNHLESQSDSDIVFEHPSVHSTSRQIGMNSPRLKSVLEDHAIDILSSHTDEENNQSSVKESRSLSTPSAKLFLYIQMQLYRKETLKDWLNNNTSNRDPHIVLDIFDQITCAVDYVHNCGLMHRDLKPSNIFFSADGVVKVGDFGLVTALSVQQDQESNSMSTGRHTAEVGTTLYMSPEQMARQPYNLKVDIFSLGLILLELWIPFSTQMERIRTLQNAKRQVIPHEITHEQALVRKMLSENPDSRPTTREVLDHPLLCELAPTRVGTRQRVRTVSNSSS